MFGSKGVLETEYGGAVLLRGKSYYNGGRTPVIYESGAVAISPPSIGPAS